MTLRWTHGLIIATLVGCGTPSGNTPPTTDGGNDVTTSPDTPSADVPLDQQQPSPDVAADTGSTDTGPTDTGPTDTGPTDTGPTDTGPTDTGPTDAGSTDTGPTDAARDVVTDGPTDAMVLEMCGDPIATIAVPGAAFMRDGMTSGMSRVSRTSCQTSASGPEDVYTLNVASRTVVNIDTEAMRTTFDSVLSLRRMCANVMTEVACDDDGGRGTTSRIRALLEPGTYALLVDGFSGGSGPYGLAVRSAEPATNGLCTMPTTLAPGASLMAQTTNGGWIVSNDCGTTEGAQRFYSVTVPAMSAVTVRATPTGMPAWTPTLRVKDSCMATTCVVRSSGEMAGMPSSVQLSNGGAMPRTYVVSVASSTTADGTYDLSATMPSTLVRGTACDSPIEFDPMTPAMGIDGTRGTVSGGGRCQAAVTGGQTFFSLRVPAGTRATLRATPTSMPAWAPTIRVFNTCTATSCVDSRVGMAGMPTVLALNNSSISAQDYIVTVAGANTMASGTFNLTAEFASISPYTFSMIAGACDSLAEGATTITPMSGMWADDSTTPITALPFTMRFFGADATHFSANSNGLVQLFPSMMGTASTEYANAVMATPSAPNNLVAVFWDDLTASAPTAAVRTATLGMAPSRRFVVQWTDWSVIGESSTRMTFQTKLFEGTGVIEMHYCSLAPMTSARVFGNSATVGIENAMGTEGVTVTHNAMASISTANAFRLTPR